MELYKYVPEEAREEQINLFKDSKFTLKEAKKKFPKWYEKVIVNKDRTPRKWDIAGKVHGENPYALYDWWKKKIYEGATYRHRYFSVMALVIYGIKCNVPEEKIRKDAEALKPFLTGIKSDDPFTDDDILSAMDCLDDRYATFPIKDIEKLTCIPIPRNKRNGRKQAVHIKYMNNQRKFKVELGECTNGGRPSKKKMVEDWQAVHPDGRKADCMRETGLSKPTVYRWWN